MDETPRRRGGRRREGGDGNRPSVPQQPPWKQPVRSFAPVGLATEDQIEAIHQTSLQILSEIGMDFLNPEARRLLAEAGARVDPDSERVRFDADFIEEVGQMIDAAERAVVRHCSVPLRVC